jgi:hypothetical protein
MKKPRLPKAAKEKAAKPTKAAGSNSVDPDKRALFLSDKEAFAKASERLKKAQSAVRTLGKTIKADGFSMRQVKLAIQLETPEGEADFKSSVANDLLAAQYVGASIGSQLAMFMEPDRTPAVERAYEEGQKASMTNGQPKPPYDPSTPQAAQWLKGFHDDTERRTRAGISKLDS